MRFPDPCDVMPSVGVRWVVFSENEQDVKQPRVNTEAKFASRKTRHGRTTMVLHKKRSGFFPLPSTAVAAEIANPLSFFCSSA
jgi:hypothetical protein